MKKITIDEQDLIDLIKLAQLDDDMWQADSEVKLIGICKKYNNIHVERPAINAQFRTTTA